MSYRPACCRDEDLRSDAVGRTDEYAFVVARQLEEAAEAADRSQLTRMSPGRGERFVLLDGRIAGRYIDTGTGVRVTGEGRLSAPRKLVGIVAHFPSPFHPLKGSSCKFTVTSGALAALHAGALVVPVFADGPLDGAAKTADEALGGALSRTF